ncbi:hypothetical protein D3C73_981120 [compost metagenome]
MGLAQFRLQRLELIRRQPLAVLGPVNQRPAGPRRIVQQRLVPGARSIVHVDGEGRRLQRRKPVMIVRRMKQLQMHHRRPAVAVPTDPHRAPADRILIGLGPARPSRNHLHPVGPQRPELVRRPVAVGVAGRLDIGVARRLQRAVKRLHQFGARLLGIGLVDQPRQRMIRRPNASDHHHQGRRRRRLGDHPHAAIGHGVLAKALGGQMGIIPRRPPRPARPRQGDQRPRPAVLALGRSHAPPTERSSPIHVVLHHRILPPRPGEGG